jgi:hypothetical protein
MERFGGTLNSAQGGRFGSRLIGFIIQQDNEIWTRQRQGGNPLQARQCLLHWTHEALSFSLAFPSQILFMHLCTDARNGFADSLANGMHVISSPPMRRDSRAELFSVAVHRLEFLYTLHTKIGVMCIIPQHNMTRI